MSKEVIPVAILVTDGVDKGRQGMATVFCHSDSGEGGVFSSAFDLTPMGLT